MNSQSKPAVFISCAVSTGARLAQADSDGELARAQLAQGVVDDCGHAFLR
jgi:hypothetical protein